MRGRQPLIAAVAGLGLVVLIVVVLLLPKVSQVSARQKDLQQAQSQEQSLRIQLRGLQALARQEPQEKQKLAALETAVPPTVDLPGLIRLLNTAAEQSGVDFMSFTPGQPTTGPDPRVSLIPTSISVGGTFFAVDQYLIQLESLPRAARVLNITVAPGGQTSELQVTLTANFFTTDTSAGPGSAPGPTGAGGGPVSPPTPPVSPSASPSITPSGPFSPAPSGSPGATPSASVPGSPGGTPSLPATVTPATPTPSATPTPGG